MPFCVPFFARLFDSSSASCGGSSPWSTYVLSFVRPSISIWPLLWNNYSSYNAAILPIVTSSLPSSFHRLVTSISWPYLSLAALSTSWLSHLKDSSTYRPIFGVAMSSLETLHWIFSMLAAYHVIFVDTHRTWRCWSRINRGLPLLGKTIEARLMIPSGYFPTFAEFRSKERLKYSWPLPFGLPSRWFRLPPSQRMLWI